MDILRVGKVSSCNYDDGKVRVVYSDRDDATTVELPLVVFNNEYYVPKVDDQVLVLHQPNGAASGFVVGDYWSDTHDRPDGTGEGKRIKYFDRDGKCYWKYEDSSEGDGEGELSLHNDDKIKINNDDDFELETKGDLTEKSDKEVTINGSTKVTIKSDGSVVIEGSSVSIKGDAVSISGVLTINGLAYLAHTHGNGNEGAPTTGVIST